MRHTSKSAADQAAERTALVICPLVFLVLCAVVIWFLHVFTVTEESMSLINWESAVQIAEDGTEQALELQGYTNMPEGAGTFRFTASLPQGLEDGYLLFETSGEELTLYLDGEEIYRSSVNLPDENAGSSQAQIPLPPNISGELTAVCTIYEGANAIFPPLIRFMPDGMTTAETMSYANRYGIPAGITALAFLLVAGIFLLTVMRNKTEWSLLPLALAMAGMLVYRIVQSCGYYFLPETAVNILSGPWTGWLTVGALAVYLIMNRRREFWKYLGVSAACSAAVLLVCWLISAARNGHLYVFLKTAVQGLFQSGIYDGLLYWITLWLAVVCALISAYWIMRSFIRQQSEARTLVLKNKLILDGYHAIENKMRDSAAQRHEWKHQLTVMEALCQSANYEELKGFLERLNRQENSVTPTRFTKNVVVNLILQDFAARAAQSETSFEAQAYLPEDLAVPEEDLCLLLMNMLDNALEACVQIEKAGKRFVRFRATVKKGYMMVKCENAYEKEPKEGPDGRLITTKTDAQTHGFGLSQMSAVAEKYHSILDISYSEEHIFTVQTALKLPEETPAL